MKANLNEELEYLSNFQIEVLSDENAVNGLYLVGGLVFTRIIPKLGETVTGSSFLLGYGGKGANQCVASKVLGCCTALIGKVGDDFFGDMFIQHLNQLGVNTDGVVKSPTSSTGVASITVETETGENQIVIVPGANMLVSENDISLAEKKLMMSSTKVVVCQFEINPLATLYSLKLGRAYGAKTILNPAPAPIAYDNSDESGNNELLGSILSNCDFVCPNESEFCSITKSSSESLFQKDGETSLLNVHAFIPGFIYFLEKNVKYPVVTLGSKGVIAVLSEQNTTNMNAKDSKEVARISFNNEKKLIVHFSAPSVTDVVDTTGAGDCFVGSLAYFVACHEDITPAEQIRRSIWVASQSVRKKGTQSSYRKCDELPDTLFGPGTFQWPE
ncbi:Ribokinase [Schistosoma japonicum]|nr:Ribokinase [Schistosoma japonicum]